MTPSHSSRPDKHTEPRLDRRLADEANRDHISDEAAPSSWRDQAEGVVDRRSGIDRRDLQPRGSGLERRRGPGRRLTDFLKAAEEGEMTQEQFMFLMAIEAFKRANARTFPAWSDVLEVIRLLGYRKTQPSTLRLNVEDWTEAADAPPNVRTRENARDPNVREGREAREGRESREGRDGAVNDQRDAKGAGTRGPRGATDADASDLGDERDFREAERHVQRERRRGRDAA